MMELEKETTFVKTQLSCTLLLDWWLSICILSLFSLLFFYFKQLNHDPCKRKTYNITGAWKTIQSAWNYFPFFFPFLTTITTYKQIKFAAVISIKTGISFLSVTYKDFRSTFWIVKMGLLNNIYLKVKEQRMVHFLYS